MTQPAKDYTSTVLRMAGNIAAGLMTECPLVPDANDTRGKAIAAAAVRVAREIVRLVVEEPQK